MAIARPIHPFLGAIGRGPIALDGAMGTALWARGVAESACLEALVVERADWVEAVHREHVAAGAAAIETNTFGANRVRLARHGLEHRVGELNHAAVVVAKHAAEGRAFVLGAIGPTGATAAESSRARDDRAREAFTEQAAALVEAGVDALVLETFYLADEIELAVDCIRGEVGNVALIAMMTVDANLNLIDKTSLISIAMRLASQVDVLGVNCCDGPATALSAIAALSRLGVPIAAAPSAGLPRRRDGKDHYQVTPEEFGAFAREAIELGAKVVGGCCGTTAAHVGATANAVDRMAVA
jgi:methionine synthase I (cobalamin-dependent)